MRHDNRYWQAKKVTLIGALINALLGVLKLIGGFLFHSHALIADGFHSFSDLLTDGMVLFASKYGSLDADDTHPYGHQRIETAATMFLSLVLVIAGAGIGWDAIDEFINQSHTRPMAPALLIALVSILANEMLYHYTRHIGEKIQSNLIIANAWHHRSDAASSIVVALGLLMSLIGFIYFDALAAVIVGLLIIKMGWDYGWNSIKELVDTAIDSDTLAQIEFLIKTVPGVEKVHQLRSRFMGRNILIDVHILVSPFISVSEGHYIAQHVHQRLMTELSSVKDVVVHVDPEDDESTSPSLHLPNRQTLEQLFISRWQAEFNCIIHWTLHYLDGNIIIDLLISANTPSSKLEKQIQQDIMAQALPIRVNLIHEHSRVC